MDLILEDLESSERREILRAQLSGSLLLFIQVFYKKLTKREFVISEPHGRESHHITICRELTKVLRGETNRLLINVSPGTGKSEIAKHFIAWSLAQYPDSCFLYLSYSHDLAAKHTYGIKQIMSLPAYRKLFDVRIKRDSSAKDNFNTEQGGGVMALGSAGSVTGQDAGLPNLDRFSGGLIMDDMHKPNEIHSESIRQSVITNYKETIKPRLRSPSVPMIFIGQRLHEDDLPNYLIQGEDGYDWKKIILEAEDSAGNILHPSILPKVKLEIERKTNPFVYWSQYQQQPIPSGGGLYREKDFPLLEEEPKILLTFITADTAETTKSFNDFTVFSFWGVYKINYKNVELPRYGLHWLNCYEFKCEPRDLEDEFIEFCVGCMGHSVQPSFAAIEKKSTGTTLVSVLEEKMRGIKILGIERSVASKNKIQRYIDMQHYIASKSISLPVHAIHTTKVLEHMTKITGNGAHKHDDICDTCYDAVKISFIDKSLNMYLRGADTEEDAIMASLLNEHKTLTKLRENFICR